MTNTILVLIFAGTSQTFSLPEGLQSALCWVESSHRPHVMHKDDGKGTSLGVCQIKIGTARMMGFHGSESDLMQPKINAYFSAKYLQHQIKRYNGNVDRAIAAYNSGTFHPEASGAPKNKVYVDKVKKAWREKR